jgi:choline kinase
VTAVILAAGVGQRLLAAAGGLPKCLLRIGGRPLLARLLDGLAAAGVRDAVVVVGFGAATVERTVGAGPPGMHVRWITNDRYREGAVLSLWAARDALGGEVLIMDADVLCPPAMIATLVRSAHPNCFLLDGSVESTGEEQMLLARGGRVLDIVRGGAPDQEVQGESVGFLKLGAGAAGLLRDLLAARIAAGDTGIEHEEVYRTLVTRVEVGYERVDGTPWTEIDFPDDVRRAEEEVLPRIEAAARG